MMKMCFFINVYFGKSPVAGITFFCLDAKEPKKSRMPYRLRAAFGPAHQGAFQYSANLALSLIKAYFFYQLFFKLDWRNQNGMHPGAGRPGKTPGGIGFVLNSLVLFVQAKRTKRRAESTVEYKKYASLSKPAVADASFFCLDTKEPKGQECRITSGRHSAHRAWVVTLQTALAVG